MFGYDIHSDASSTTCAAGVRGNVDRGPPKLGEGLRKDGTVERKCI